MPRHCGEPRLPSYGRRSRQIATQTGDPYKVFTPYWQKLRAQLRPAEPLRESVLPGWRRLPGGLGLSALGLLPSIRWDTEIFGDDAINGYALARDLPARHGTSRLSPHLHFGEISPRQIHFELDRLMRRADATPAPEDIETYLRELAWREFAHHLLFHFPKTAAENFNPRFADFKWAASDAGMRELWHTGWMHNRVRMIVASFLTKNLRQHWLHGARWFWDTLVDADLANNTLGWQWVAGCGTDAAPYFRVFNPVTQAKKFDPDGVYLRRWLPELGGAPLDLLHEPWRDPSLLSRSGYAAPIVDLAGSRQYALAAYQARRRP